jgi:threonyl-tRNA synthetase
MSPQLTVTLPDGSARELESGATIADVAAAIGPRLAKAAVAGVKNGQLVDLSTELSNGDQVSVVTPTMPEGREVLRHSTAHVLAQAVTRLWPGAKYAIGPVIADGFYYDFDLPDGARFTDHDLERIEATMREIVAEDQPFIRSEHSVDEGLSLFAHQPYKCEIIEAVGPDASDVDAAPQQVGGEVVVSAYRNSAEFVDLCRGPHVPSTAKLGHFKLQRVAGAYWRGDVKRPQLQRIYGTAFETREALEQHLYFLEEAKRRDHRVLGQQLDLFSFPDEIGPGLAVFHPKGGTIRRVMEEYSRKRHVEEGYEFVYTPHVTKGDLFVTSGHLEWYAEGMYPPMELDDGQQYYLKPMNCPFHTLIFKSNQRSYRELPIRYFEFGSVYRYELSGAVHGLTRVRGMTQDDAHIFCTKDQMEAELTSLLTFVLDLLREFGLSDFYLELSTRPPLKSVGSDEDWNVATETLRSVATSANLELVLDEGGGAFYGPKISVQARDAIGRTHQMSTIQLDFQTPQRFDAEYVGNDNAKHQPIMIHRALFGSVERFMAILIEHYAGALPTWLSPEQVRVLPVRDSHGDYAHEVGRTLTRAGLRVRVEHADEPLGSRIRRAKVEKVPYVLVVGDDDVNNATIGINTRGAADPFRGVSITEFLAHVNVEIANRTTVQFGTEG